MNRFYIILIAVLALSGCQEERTTASRETSPGGISYTLISMPDAKKIAIQVAWPSHWNYREGVNPAAPYVGARLILEGGAEGYPAGVAGERLSDLDSGGRLTPTIDHLLGALTFEKKHMAETIKLANAHLRQPSFDDKWFRRISSGIAKNLAEVNAQPVTQGYNAAGWAIFGDSPIREALFLTGKEIFENLTLNDITAWYEAILSQTPDALILAGDINQQEAGKAIDALFDGLPEPAARARQEQTTPDISPRRILLHLPEIETPYLAFIGLIPPTRLGKEMEDLIILQALSGGHQSVLLDAVRTRLRASYDFRAFNFNYSREHRALMMDGLIEASKLKEAEEAVRAAYDKFRMTGLSNEIADLMAPFVPNFENLKENVIDLSFSTLQAELDGHDVNYSLRLTEALNALEKEDILNRLQADYPRADDFLVIAVSPDPAALPDACVISAPSEAVNCQ